MLKFTLFSFLMLVLSCGGEPEASQLSTHSLVDRPPQYVLLAFDGSKSHTMWRNTVEFSSQFEEAHPGRDLKFTFFVSGVYWLKSSNKNLYKSARHKRGKSAIGFGGNSDSDIVTRTELTNHALELEHEVASHACGHYDGSDWSKAEWLTEFDYFNNFILNSFELNDIPPQQNGTEGLDLSESDIVGFRAPLLGRGTGLYSALSERRFDYDTSQVASMNYWPQKKQGVWDFPLASLRIVTGYKDGEPVLGKRTLSMDYNFYYAQSKAKPADPSKHQMFEDQMYYSYWEYFKSNYYGNRAPVDIGHHFSLWNGGAYWRAMKRFATKVCAMEEVRCVTYKEYVSYLEALDRSTLAKYRKGQFPRLASFDDQEPVMNVSDWGLPDVAGLNADELKALGFVPDSPEAHLEEE